MKQLFYPIVWILILSAFACGNLEKKQPEVSRMAKSKIVVSKLQFKNSGMELGPATKQAFPEVVNVRGMIDVPPENRAVISATMGGYVKETPWLIGDQVRKGQALVTLENPEFVKIQQEYLEVKEQLKYLKSEYERQQILFKEKISSQKNYLKTESEYKRAAARFSGLKKQLEMLNISTDRLAQGELVATSTIYSPINGSITSVNVSKGTYVSPASAIMEIVDHSHIHLELSVFEKDIMKIKKEQEIEFKIPEASEEVFEAKVHLVGTSIGKNRSIKVHGHLKDETANNFLTGMYVEARIITDNREHTSLPNDAVVLVDDLSYVLLLEEETENEYVFKQIEIKVGTTSDRYTAILNTEQFDQDNEFLINGSFHLIKDL